MEISVAAATLIGIVLLIGGSRLIDRVDYESPRKKALEIVFATLGMIALSLGSAFFSYCALHSTTTDMCIVACENCYRSLFLMWLGPALVVLLVIWAHRFRKPLSTVSLILALLLTGEAVGGMIFFDKRMNLTRDHYLHHQIMRPGAESST